MTENFKVLIINPPFLPELGRFSRYNRSPAITKSGTLYYPLWTAFATGVLEKAGFSVKLVDAPAQRIDIKALIEISGDYRPDLVSIETSTPSIYSDIETARAIKSKLPNTKICLTGTQVSALPDETLTLAPDVDFIARGEYDYTLLELAQKLSGGSDISNIQGISFRKDGEIIHNPDRPYIQKLDNLPFLAEIVKKHLNVYEYFFAVARYPMIMMITGRGCPYKCIFCLWPQTLHGRGYRLRSAENVAEEFRYIRENLPEVKEVVIEDDTFTANIKRIREICRILIDEGNKLLWTANVRASLDYDTMVLMKRASCRMIIVGYEAGDAETLKRMHKGITLDMSYNFARSAKRAGLLVHGCFMAGNPGEDRRCLTETLNMAKRLAPDTAQFFPVMAYPGTEAYEWAKRNGFLMSNNYRDWVTVDGLHNCVIRTEHLSPKTLVYFCDYARRNFYIRAEYLYRKAIQSLFKFEEMKRNLIAFKNIIRHLVMRG
ncbi:MAG: radical SAM protein [bacterium]